MSSLGSIDLQRQEQLQYVSPNSTLNFRCHCTVPLKNKVNVRNNFFYEMKDKEGEMAALVKKHTQKYTLLFEVSISICTLVDNESHSPQLEIINLPVHLFPS